jgi:hypothetical protein
MKNKHVSSSRPIKKANTSSHTSESKSNVEHKKSNYSQQKKTSGDMQSGFSEPGNERRTGGDFSETTVGVP